MWIDSHCHLDASEFDADRADVVARAREAGVGMLVLPAVAVRDFDTVRELAHTFACAYALGIHPLFVKGSMESDLDILQAALERHRDDPRLVAVGEIGLDHFVPGHDRERQERFYLAQLSLARRAGLPVIVHVRRSADTLMKGLRRIEVMGGIAHAFNGSAQQAGQFVDRGFALGFGGAMTFDRALQIRELAGSVPDTAIVLETDSPDIPPHWLYRTVAQRSGAADAEGDATGQAVLSPKGQGRNEPSELPRIAATLSGLRGWSREHTAAITSANACRVLPKLGALS